MHLFFHNIFAIILNDKLYYLLNALQQPLKIHIYDKDMSNEFQNYIIHLDSFFLTNIIDINIISYRKRDICNKIVYFIIYLS